MKSLFCLICICSFFTLPLLDIYGADSSITCIKFETLGRLEPRPDLENYIETNNFKVHWESPTTQTYAQNAANYAEYARDQECNHLHWRVPPADGGRGGNDKYDIYILNDLNGNRGQTFPDAEQNWQYEWTHSFIEIINTLIDDDEKMTIAHEINHSCQFAYSYKDLEDGTWFYENTATWVAEEVYNLCLSVL